MASWLVTRECQGLLIGDGCWEDERRRILKSNSSSAGKSAVTHL